MMFGWFKRFKKFKKNKSELIPGTIWTLRNSISPFQFQDHGVKVEILAVKDSWKDSCVEYRFVGSLGGRSTIVCTLEIGRFKQLYTQDASTTTCG